MKKFIFICILVTANCLSAQTLRTLPGNSAVDGLKGARKALEAQTETSILEKLEESRMADEKKRYQEFESLNLSVVQDETSSY